METKTRWGEKRYNSLNYFLRNKFGEKTFKISLDGGFTCPNRDGKVAKGGCTFCSSSGSGDYAGERVQPIGEQFDNIKIMMNKKWKTGKYIAYFQAYTNTYAPLNVLKDKFEEALSFENVIGLSISTRPDCLEDGVVDYLAELNERTNLWVELGLQTIHDVTSKKINRGHDYDTFLEGLKKLQDRNIKWTSWGRLQHDDGNCKSSCRYECSWNKNPSITCYKRYCSSKIIREKTI